MNKNVLKKTIGTDWRKLFTVAFLLMVSLSLRAQVTVTIPVNNDNDDWMNYPYSCADAYQRTQSIYTASEIGQTGNITSIGFFVNALNNPNPSTPVEIKLRNTKKSTVTRSSYDDASYGATSVYSGNILNTQLSANGWVTVTLTTPFAYAGFNLDVIVETNYGSQGEDWDAKQFRWSDISRNATQTWSHWQNPPGPDDYGNIMSLRPNIRFTIAPGSAMTYVSTTTEQLLSSGHINSIAQKVIAVKVETSGLTNALAANAFTMNTVGSSSTPGLIQNARLYFTGIGTTFDTSEQFGSTVVSPSGNFSFTGNRTLESGINHFWLTYDISSSALIGDSVDAECTQITVNSINRTPTVMAPSGKIDIGRLYNFEAASNQSFFTQSFSFTPSEWKRSAPLTGPSAAYSGTNCWGTVLSRNMDHALTTPAFVVDRNDANITYKQWYDFANEYNDMQAVLEYQVNNGGWNTLNEINLQLKHTTSGNWDDAFSYLPASIGDTVQLRWILRSYRYTQPGAGWYIDNLVMSGARTYNQAYVASYTSQRPGIVLPEFKNQAVIGMVIEATGSDNPLAVTDFDFTTAGTGTVANIESARIFYTGPERAFDTLTPFGSPLAGPSGSFTISGSQNLLPGYNHFWLTYDIDAGALSGDSLDATCQQIKIGGAYQTPAETDPAGHLPVGYLYDFETPGTESFQVTSLNANRNEWEKGTPNDGPLGAFSGTECWGTNLNGNYSQSSDYVLVSPPYIASGDLAGASYKQWFDFAYTYANVSASFEYQVNNAGWNTLMSIDNGIYANSNNQWETAMGDFMVTPGDTVQFRWHFWADRYSSTAAGWYIDNFITAGLKPFAQVYLSSTPQTAYGVSFKGATKQAILQIPVEVAGSVNPLTLDELHFNTAGTGTVANILAANVYYTGSGKTFDAAVPFGTTITAPSGTFTVTGSQELLPGTNYFWLAYDVDNNALVNDSLDAELNQIILSSGTKVPLVTTPENNIKIGRVYDFDVAGNEGFVAASLNSKRNQWEKGAPNSGPYAAYSGTDCWATGLNEDAFSEADYAFSSVPYVAVMPEINVSFKQWFDFAYQGADIEAYLEYNVNNTGWNIGYSIDNSNRANSNYKWETADAYLAVNVGDTVQLRWRFKSAPWSPWVSGWFVDDFTISGVDLLQQSYLSTETIQIDEATMAGRKNQAVVQIAVNASGSKNPLSLTSFDLNTNGSVTGIINAAKIFYTGSNNAFDTLTLFGSTSVAPAGAFAIGGNQQLSSGINYFWLTYDISAAALEGDSVDVECTDVIIASTIYPVTNGAPSGSVKIGRMYDFDVAGTQGFYAMTLNAGINQWEKGAPLNGPSSAYSGTDCWATNLSGDYNKNADYALVSPPYIAKADVLYASYKQWFDFLYTYNNVVATFESNINNTGWQFITEIDNRARGNSDYQWEDVKTQVYAAIGDTVQFRWRFQTMNTTDPAAGWYVDDFLVSGVTTFGQTYVSAQAEQVFSGAYAGAKQVPVIKVQVEAKGSQSPLTVSDLNFTTAASASIVEKATLYFTGSNNLFDSLTPFGTSVNTPSGAFAFNGTAALNDGSNYFWLVYDVAPSALAGDSVDAVFTQLTVAAAAQTPGVTDPAGVVPVGRLFDFETSGNENFTTALLNGDAIDWQKGVPVFANGPASAYSGAQCWGTNLDRNFTLSSDYTLVTPPFIAEQPSMFVSYKQWFEFYYTSWDKRAEFQYQENNSGTWSTLAFINLMDIASSNNNWLDEQIQLNTTPGDTFQFRWRIYTGNYNEGPGWYVDNLLVAGGRAIDVLTPSIKYTRLQHTSSNANRTLTNFAAIEDEKGVDVATGTAPRIYFRKTSEANAFTGNSSGNNGWKYVEAGNTTSPFSFVLDYSLLTSPVNQGDTIVYFVTAQDLNIPANTGATPFAGFAASSVNAISAAPSTPDFYVITASPMNGNYNVGAGQPYTTLSAAVTDVNLRGVSGPVTLTLTNPAYNASTGETFPITFYPVAGTSATNTVTVKPATSNSVSFTANNAVFKIQGADYIVIDGSNSGTSSRNMTINATGTTAALWMCANETNDGAENNIVKNCIIRGNALTKFGIYSGSASYTSLSAAVSAPSSYNRFENNLISSVQQGIFMRGVSKINPDVNNTFIKNQFGDATTYISMLSIYNMHHFGDTVIDNSVENVNYAFNNVYRDAGGIFLESCKQSFVSGNKITNWKSTMGEARLFGIFVDGGENGYDSPVLPTNNTIVNNFIGNGYSTSNQTWNISGLMVYNGSGDRVYFNTVSLTGDLLKTDGAVFAFRSGEYNQQNIDIRNNIFFINGSSTEPAVFIGHSSYSDYSSSGSISDYNLVSSTATGNARAYYGEYYGNWIPTFSDWQMASGQDANSKSANVTFVSATDLHLAGASIGDSLNLSGTPIAGFTTDIDGQLRHTTPYMGADENTSTPLPVELLEFVAAADGNDVRLNWATASENNNKGFVIERSADNKNFIEVDFVKGKNNKVKTSYRYNDVQALASAPVLYYRLKQLDNNGTFAYSRSVRVSRNDIKQGSNLVTYPNPFVKDVFIQFESNEASVINVTLTDLTGRVISATEHQAATGKNNIQVISNDALQAGVYFLTVESINGKETIKLIRQ